MKKRDIFKIKVKIIVLIIIAVLAVILAFAVFKTVKYIANVAQNRKIAERVSQYVTSTSETEGQENVPNVNVDFTKLKAENSDTIGYLKVNGTEIDDVVVQCKDNNYYMYHNFELKKNKAGWIFADYRNKFDGTDKNIVIYGHNMKDGSMFSSLKNILDKEWQDNEDNKRVTFVTENEKCIYEVFSVYQIESEDYYIQTDFADDEDYQRFLSTIKARSKKYFRVNVTGHDSILTLSTCANNNKYRVVLHAKKLKS